MYIACMRKELVEDDVDILLKDCVFMLVRPYF
jgi:hypothetical protein